MLSRQWTTKIRKKIQAQSHFFGNINCQLLVVYIWKLGDQLGTTVAYTGSGLPTGLFYNRFLGNPVFFRGAGYLAVIRLFSGLFWAKMKKCLDIQNNSSKWKKWQLFQYKGVKFSRLTARDIFKRDLIKVISKKIKLHPCTLCWFMVILIYTSTSILTEYVIQCFDLL